MKIHTGLVGALALVCLTGAIASTAPYRVTETSVAVLHPNGKLLTFSGSATVRELLGALVNKEGCELHAAEGHSVYSADSLVMWAFLSEQAGSEATHKITCVDSKTEAALTLTRYEMPNLKSMLKNPSKSHAKPQPATPNAPREYPFEFIEIMGDTIESDLAWAKSFAENHWGKMHPFPTYQGTQETGVYHLNTGAVVHGRPTPSPVDDQEVRIGLAADWGAGTRESDYVQQLMVKDWNPQWTLHLGDVYYVGAPDQMKSNVLGIPPANTQKGVKWPVGSLGSFALNGNHEMYSRGFGYFDVWFPALGLKNQTTGQMNGQKASYVALENAYYRLIHLDTGYGTYSPVFENDNNPQPQAVMDWLTNVVKLGDPSDTRAIVFLSHHQFRSAWEGGYRATAEQLAKLLPPGRTVLWLWGHEHRLSFYNNGVFENVTLSHYARCVGVSGFPVSINAIPKDPRGSNLVAYDKREYAIAKGTLNIPVGFNGYMRITLKGASMQADYFSLKLDQSGKVSNQTADLLVTETWKANGLGDIQLTNFTIVNPNITIVQHHLGENDKGKLSSKPLW